ncbi:MAG TPA: NAD-dependent epimerase/dehydratase family protein [Thermoplasmata archaeon]|nr:NAD-dependent epimerase/dehydratase family protein [Thermoplasmata archaeon]
MRYFVTGATGFIGKVVARQLRDAGHEVTALVRDPNQAGGLAALGANLARGDVTAKDTLREPMRGVDGVFHIAGWYKVGVKDKRDGVRVNVEGTRNVLETMQELGVPKGVYTSTLAVFGDTRGKIPDETYRTDGPWLSEYDRTKWVAHYEVAEPMIRRGLPLVIVQPGLVYGPGSNGPERDTFVRLLQGKLRAVPRRSAFCWGHVEDIARGHLLAMEKGRPGESYIIAGPPHPLTEVMALTARIAGRKPPLAISPALVKFLASLTRSEYLRVAAGVTYLGSNAKARREWGYQPRPIGRGIRELLAYEMKLLLTSSGRGQA